MASSLTSSSLDQKHHLNTSTITFTIQVIGGLLWQARLTQHKYRMLSSAICYLCKRVTAKTQSETRAEATNNMRVRSRDTGDAVSTKHDNIESNMAWTMSCIFTWPEPDRNWWRRKAHWYCKRRACQTLAQSTIVDRDDLATIWNEADVILTEQHMHILLYYYYCIIIILLYYYIIMLLYYFIFVLLYYYIILLLYYYNIILLYCNIILLFYYCIFILLYYFIIVLFCYFVIILYYYFYYYYYYYIIIIFLYYYIIILSYYIIYIFYY